MSSSLHKNKSMTDYRLFIHKLIMLVQLTSQQNGTVVNRQIR